MKITKDESKQKKSKCGAPLLKINRVYDIYERYNQQYHPDLFC